MDQSTCLEVFGTNLEGHDMVSRPYFSHKMMTQENSAIRTVSSKPHDDYSKTTLDLMMLPTTAPQKARRTRQQWLT